MIFVDTGAWIALFNQRDRHHDDASAIYSTLARQNAQLLTTDYVIDETITRLRYDASHATAIQFLNFMEHSEETEVLTVVEIDATLFREAKRLFRQYADATLSFTDCTSFVVCQMHRISEAYAFDQHFAMMGISLLKSLVASDFD